MKKHFQTGIRGAVLAVPLLGAAALALAGPPFATDDPEPVEYQHHELYLATQQTKTQDGRTGTLPHVEYNYGVAPDVQLHAIVPWSFSSPNGGPHEHGLGDIELGVKYRLVQETDSRPMVGIFPLVEVPSGDSDKGLGNGTTQVFLPLWLQKKFGEGWQTYGGGGYWINHAAGARNHWFFGWQVQKDLSEQLTLGAEIFHSTAQFVGGPASTGFNVGGIYNFDEHNHLLFSAGTGLQHANETNQFSSYLAYQRTW